MSRSSRIKTALVDARIHRGREGGFRVLLRQQFAGRPLERELHFQGSPEELASSGAATMYCPSCKAVRRCDPVAAGRLGPEFRQRLADGRRCSGRCREEHAAGGATEASEDVAGSGRGAVRGQAGLGVRERRRPGAAGLTVG